MIEDIDHALLASLPLPKAEGGDKEDRGRVLVVGGSSEAPGGAYLAAVAALRAGAGKLQVASDPAVTAGLAANIPEARVFAWDLERVTEAVARCDAAVVGPGMLDEEESRIIAAAALRAPGVRPLALDAAALNAASVAGRPRVLTPHAGEMASLLEIEKEAVEAEPVRFVRAAAERFSAVVALKGATTYVCAPDGRTLCHRDGVFGLATSGSGDVLAGVLGGLLARGAAPLTALAWAVAAHGRAGARLSARIAPLGFLAREILDEIPQAFLDLGANQTAATGRS